jgi:hypothetical protein
MFCVARSAVGLFSDGGLWQAAPLVITVLLEATPHIEVAVRPSAAAGGAAVSAISMQFLCKFYIYMLATVYGKTQSIS